MVHQEHFCNEIQRLRQTETACQSNVSRFLTSKDHQTNGLTNERIRLTL